MFSWNDKATDVFVNAGTAQGFVEVHNAARTMLRHAVTFWEYRALAAKWKLSASTNT